LLIVSNLSSPLALLQNFSDNNHLLNSLQMFYLFPGPDWAYHILPTATSILSLSALWYLLKEKEPAVQITTVALFALSFPLIVHTTEARGYSFLLLALLSSLIFFQSQKKGSAFGFWLSSVFGILSHYSFLTLTISYLVTDTVLSAKKAGKTLPLLLVFHLPVLCFCALLYLLHLQYLTPGTGPLTSHFEVLANTLSVSFGGIELDSRTPLLGALTLSYSVAIAFLLLFGIRDTFKKGSSLGIFFLLSIVIVPAATIMLWQPRVLFPRYFLVSIACSYLLLGSYLPTLVRRGAPGKTFALLFGFILFSGFLFQDSRFLLYARGEYDIARDILKDPSSGIARIDSDHPYRFLTVFKHNCNSSCQKRFLSEEASSVSAQSNWFVLQDHHTFSEFPPTLAQDERLYQLYRTYRHAGLSGFTWGLYRNNDDQSSAP
ncbi:MAG: hypothetical protein KDD55_01700, partial [Bdellovibrionales bacterium]|nr:hypothetical protein [Bdellovibrionales bacterium]